MPTVESGGGDGADRRSQPVARRGRSGLLCAAVVGALVWLALPLCPARSPGSATRCARRRRRPWRPRRRPCETAALDPAADLDCRTLYPDRLWARAHLEARRAARSGPAPPATAVTALVDALQPAVRVTCSWRSADGQIVSTLSPGGGGCRRPSPTPRCAARASTCETFGAGRWRCRAPAGRCRRGAHGARRAVARQRRDARGIPRTTAPGSPRTCGADAAQLPVTPARCGRRCSTCSRSARGSSTACR